MNVLTKAHHFKNHKTSTREQVLKFLGKKKRSYIRISVLRHLVLAHGLTSKKKKKKKIHSRTKGKQSLRSLQKSSNGT